MRLYSTIITLFSIANAAIDFGDWHPPVEGDVRSPCPGLNTLANHNILPHNGKNISVAQLVKAMNDGYNISAEVATIVSLGALQTAPSGSKTIDLNFLSKHNIIEHDGSLSRKDAESGDATTFDPAVFEEFLGYMKGAKDVTIQNAADGRWGRILSSRATNSHFTYRSDNRFSSYLETTIYYLALTDPKTKTVPSEWLNVFFREERLPYNEGWRVPQVITNGATLSGTVLLLSLATPEGLTLSDTEATGFHAGMLTPGEHALSS